MPDLPFLQDLSWLQTDITGRLVLATLLGGAIGLEREWSGKPAGLRTNLLICVGAALLTDLSLVVAGNAAEGLPADPGRIAAQIVSGIGFLGAGTIIQSRVGVTGLTTAATLWVVAAIGMAVGAGAYPEAIATAALVLIALLVLGRIEGRITRYFEGRLEVTMEPDEEVADRVEALVASRVEHVLIEMERDDEQVSVTYVVTGHQRNWQGLVVELMDLEGVHGVKGS